MHAQVNSCEWSETHLHSLSRSLSLLLVYQASKQATEGVSVPDVHHYRSKQGARPGEALCAAYMV